MTSNIKYTGAAILAVILISTGSFYMGKSSQKTSEQNLATTTPEAIEGLESGINEVSAPNKPTAKPAVNNGGVTVASTAGLSSYASSEYGFTMKYPSYVKARPGFSTFHELGNNWRLYALPANQGKPVVTFSIYSIDQGIYSSGKQKYPLYFTAEVRVGVSPNVKECYSTDAGYANQKVTNVTINGVAFKKFSTSESGMMKYTQAESYRTVHRSMCYVIEQIKSGTTYRDELMATGVAESTLTGYYATGETIVKTFRFTK